MIRSIPRMTKSSVRLTRLSSSVAWQSTDGKFDKQVKSVRSEGERGKSFNYMMIGGSRFLMASMARVAVVHFIASMSASADVLALASVEVDISNIAPGTTATIKWRGKPVFIRHRTEAEISAAASDDSASMVDPEPDADRVKDSKWLVVLGVCTHLGCVPVVNAGNYGGWFCPCHGSHYDVSGRIRKGPAPLNLEVPEYRFEDETKLVIG